MHSALLRWAACPLAVAAVWAAAWQTPLAAQQTAAPSAEEAASEVVIDEDGNVVGTPMPGIQTLPVEPLAAELTDRVAELKKLAADDDAFEKASDLAWPSATGVLACLGQALAMHPNGTEAPGDKLAIRDVALTLYDAADAEEARGLLDTLDEAVAAPGATYVDSPDAAEPEGVDWYSLIDSYSLMEEINTRQSKIVRVMRRPRGKADEAAHAAVIALLCYPMHAQAEDYVDPVDVPDYQRLAAEYQSEVVKMSEAILKKDKRALAKSLETSRQSCNQCHEKYRDG